MSGGKCLRCALSRRRYSGIGGRIARGAGLRPLPTGVAAANNLDVNLIVCSVR